LPDFVIKLQLDLFKWTDYWKNVIEWKFTGKYPMFILDLESMNRFASQCLTINKAVEYLKGEYKRALTDYKYNSEVSKQYKKNLKELLEDYLILQDTRKQVQNKESNIRMDLGLKTADKSRPSGLDSTTDNPGTINTIKPYLTSNQAMQILGIKKTSFWKWVKEYQIELYQAGGKKKLYKTDDILNKIKLSKRPNGE